MCSFCEKEERITKNVDFTSKISVELTMLYDLEMECLKVRLQLGSIGYTLPIKMNYCLFCGTKL